MLLVSYDLQCDPQYYKRAIGDEYGILQSIADAVSLELAIPELH
jgi:CelD/BcsL family acetyltransferase involved in cellulose biosynthesis